MIEQVPAILEVHLSVHSMILHLGANDVVRRQSAKLNYEFESLATTIESLGKSCIFSGLIPTLSSKALNTSATFSVCITGFTLSVLLLAMTLLIILAHFGGKMVYSDAMVFIFPGIVWNNL